MKKSQMETIEKFNKIEKKQMMEIKEVKAACDHKYPNGKSALVSDGEGLHSKCKICDQRIDLKVMEQNEIQNAVNIVINAIECIKVSEESIDPGILRDLGIVKLMLRKLPDNYQIIFADTIQSNNNCMYDGEDEYYNNFQNMGMLNPMMANMMNNPMFAMQGKKNKDKDKDKKKKKGNGNNYYKEKKKWY